MATHTVETVDDANNEGSLAGLKVMVIDDSKTIRRTAETLLKKEACDVVTATDGFEALAAYLPPPERRGSDN